MSNQTPVISECNIKRRLWHLTNRLFHSLTTFLFVEHVTICLALQAEEHDDVTGVETQGRARSRSRAAPRASAPSGTRRAHTNNPGRPRATEPQQAAPDSGPVPQSPKHKMALRPGGPCHACACTSKHSSVGLQ